MSRFRDLSLSAKIRALIMLTSLAVLTLTVGVLFAYEAAAFRAGLRRTLTLRADIVAANSASALAFDDPAAALDTLSSLRADPHLLQAALYRKDGRPLAVYAPPGREAGPPAAPPADGQRFGPPGGLPGRVALTAPVLLRSERIGTIYLEEGLDEFYATLKLFAATAVLLLLAALAVAYALAARFQRLVSGPILELADAAQEVSRTQDFSRRVAQGGSDEIGALIEDFNAMLGQLQARDAALKNASDGLERTVLERTAELRSANAELEAFSYSVSHDLRAPLRAVDCFSKLLEEEYSAALDAPAKDYLRRVRAAGQRMDLLIQGLLELARVGRTPLRRLSVDLSALARDMAAELKERYPGRRVDFVIASGVTASGDPTLLRSVLENLLHNAWKFTGKRPSARIEFGVRRSDGRDVYFVRDDGAGFEPAAAKNLFTVFTRLHGAADFPGNGIGLASVARIVARHGGAVWAEGAVEAGATFYFTLSPEGGRPGPGRDADILGPRTQADPGPQTVPPAGRGV